MINKVLSSHFKEIRLILANDLKHLKIYRQSRKKSVKVNKRRPLKKVS